VKSAGKNHFWPNGQDPSADLRLHEVMLVSIIVWATHICAVQESNQTRVTIQPEIDLAATELCDPRTGAQVTHELDNETLLLI